jgi:hypothetical protein
MFLPVVLCRLENSYPNWKEEHRLTLSENRVLRRIFKPKKEEVTGKWRRLCMSSFKIRTIHETWSVTVIKSRSVRWMGYNEKWVQDFGYGIQKENGIKVSICFLVKLRFRVSIGFSWIKLISNPGLLWTRYCTFMFQRIQEIFRFTERLLASEKDRSMKIICNYLALSEWVNWACNASSTHVKCNSRKIRSSVSLRHIKFTWRHKTPCQWKKKRN